MERTEVKKEGGKEGCRRVDGGGRYAGREGGWDGWMEGGREEGRQGGRQ